MRTFGGTRRSLRAKMKIKEERAACGEESSPYRRLMAMSVT
jgi:hypothetical protein